MDKIGIVIVNYNNHSDTIECIDSIEKYCKINYEIIVVDNNSQKECIEILRNNSYRFNLILSNKNNGFAVANNIGIDYAKKLNCNYILLLNNDTIITKNSIETMYYEFIKRKNEKIGIVTCRITYNSKRNIIWYDGGVIDYGKFLGVHKNKGEDFNKIKEEVVEEVDFISGCCMLIKTETIEKVGEMPIEYFMYFEDVDYCIKMKEKGYKMIICRNSLIYHKVSATSGGEVSPFTIEWGNRNRLLIIKKYKYKFNKFSYIRIIFKFYISRIYKIIYYTLKKENKNIEALLKGIKNSKYSLEKINSK